MDRVIQQVSHALAQAGESPLKASFELILEGQCKMIKIRMNTPHTSKNATCLFFIILSEELFCVLQLEKSSSRLEIPLVWEILNFADVANPL